MSSVSSQIPFIDLCRVCAKISESARDKKSVILRKYISYFREYSEKMKQQNKDSVCSFFPVFRLLLPQLDRERGAYGVKENTLAKIYIRILYLPKEGLDANRLLNYKTGSQAVDFAEVAYCVLRSRCPEDGKLTVDEVNSHLNNIASKHASHDPRGVDQELIILLQKMSALEQKWLIRMLLKDMKLGLGANRILNSFHKDAQELFDVTSNLSKVCETLSNPEACLHEIEISVFSPFRPMLAERCDIKNVEKCLKNGQLYYIETKFDGERFQIHVKDGVFKYYSRNGYEYTQSFGETPLPGSFTASINNQLSPRIRSVILDGEMMGWNTKYQCFTSKGSNFDVKSLRIGNVFQPCFCVFDVLMLNDEVLSNKPFHERISILKTVFTSVVGVIMHSERTEVTNVQQVVDELNSAIDNMLEGIVVKDPMSIYKPNMRTKGGWYKIKPEYTEGLMDHMSTIIMGGYYGEGRRRGKISHFLIGVAVPSNNSSEISEFHSVGRVGSGYSLDELAELLQKLKPHWREVRSGQNIPSLVWTKEKPDLWIEPNKSFLLDIKASEIISSNFFKMGYTFRFPRVESIRYDKTWKECITIKEFEEERQKASGKLATTHFSYDSLTQSPSKKIRTQSKPVVTLGDQFQKPDLAGIRSIANLFEGKEICVMTGSGTKTKQDFEKLVVQYGGTIVQNPGPKTFCVLSSLQTNARVQNVIKRRQQDVVKISWLERIIEEGHVCLPEWTPSDLLSSSFETSEIMVKKFDKFGDSYTVPATLESLTYCFNQIQPSLNLSEDLIAETDIELFYDHSPYGIFRLCRGYFDKINSKESETNPKLLKCTFKFFGGTVIEDLDQIVTHVFMFSEERLKGIQNINRKQQSKFHIVTGNWIIESIKHKKRLLERDCFLNFN